MLSVKDLTLYAFLDPAGGKRHIIKTVRARSAIVVIGVDNIERIYTLYTWADRASTDELLEQIFYVREMYQPSIFGCEANAQQALFATTVNIAARYKGLDVALCPVIQPTKITKEFRIRTILQPIIGTGRLFLQPHQHELRTEITGFPTGRTVDLVDALASACSLVPHRAGPRRQEAEDDNLKRYLADTGMSEPEIEYTLGDLDRGLGHGPRDY